MNWSRAYRLSFILSLVALTAGSDGIRAQLPTVSLTPDEMRFLHSGLALDGMAQANLLGDPSKPGPYTVRLRFPAGYVLAPHSHPDEREVTILSGTWLTGYGNRFNEAGLKALPAGSYYTEPANVFHFVRTEGPVMIQVSGLGPSGRLFADAPSGGPEHDHR